MGYDMRIVGQVDAAPANEIEAAKKELDAFQNRRNDLYAKVVEEWKAAGRPDGRMPADTPEIKEADAAMWAAWSAYEKLSDPGYFRLNIWGMSHYWGVMDELGMVYSSNGPDRDWPEWDEVAEEADPEGYEAVYEELCRPLREYHDPDGPDTIPGHKFGSNDGWLVTPAEIDAALVAYVKNRPHASQEVRDFTDSGGWQDWLDYLRLAKDHGGFAVH